MINNRYKIEQLIGTGGFAKVYRAIDIKLGIPVALKRFSIDEMKAKFSGREDYLEKYSGLGEVRRAILLNHPNVLRYFDVFTYSEQGTFGEETYEVIVMEYLPDGDFEAFAKRHPVGSPEFEKAIRGVLAGLDYLHKNQIIHRDLKSANVLFHKTTAKITDFGISKAHNPEGNDLSSALIGTPEINAPERIAPEEFGIQGRVSYNSDLWSFGVMLYRLCVGKYPFGSREGGNTDSGKIINNIFREDYQIPHMDNIPQPYRKLVEACLVRKAADRLPSATEGLKILDREKEMSEVYAAAGGETIFAEKPVRPSKKEKRKTTTTAKQRKEKRRPAVPAWALAATAAVLLSVSGWLFWPQSTPKKTITTKKDETTGLYGYVDEKDKWVIPARFEKAGAFSKGLAEVHVADSVYTINKQGELVELLHPTAEETEQRIWEEAKEKNTKASYNEYLAAYPQGKFAEEAKMKTKELEQYAAENTAWEKAQKKDRKSAYYEYLDAFPNGRYAKEAQKRIAEIKAEDKRKAEAKKKADDTAWASAKRKHTIAAYQAYLQKYPNGRHSSEARKKLKQLKSGINTEGEIETID